MKEVIRETLTRLEIAVANREITESDIDELLGELMPKFTKLYKWNVPEEENAAE